MASKIPHTALFDFPAYGQAIKDANAATTEFGKNVGDILKRLKTDQKEVTLTLQDYANILKSFNTMQAGAADGLKQYGNEIEGTSAKLKELKTVQGGWAQIVDVQKASIRELKAEFAGLKKQYEALRPDQAGYAEQVAVIEARIRQVTPAINAHTAAVRANSAGIKAAEGTYRQYSNELALLRTQLIDMPNAFDKVTGKLNKNNLEAVQLIKQIQSLDQSLKKMDDTMGQHVRNVGHYENAFSGIGHSFKELGSDLLAAVGVTSGIFALTQFLTDSVEKFNEEEQAISRLQNTLSNVGRSDLFDEIREKAHKLHEEFSTFEDKDIVEAFQKLITFGKLTRQQMDELIPVIINFAAKQRITLPEATNVFLKALEGNTRGLREYGINIKDVKTESERFGVIMSELAPRVEGAAKAFGETTAGQIEKTKVEIVELKETIGKQLQPTIKGFYEGISGLIQGIESLFAAAKRNFTENVHQISFSFQFLASSIGGNPSSVLAQEQLRRNQKEAEANQEKFNEQRKAAQQEASSYADQAIGKIEEKRNAEINAANSSVKVESQRIAKIKEINDRYNEAQKHELESQKALLKASADNYGALAEAGKKNTAEGHAAAMRLIQDALVVQELDKKIKESQDKRIIGTGGGLDSTDKAAEAEALRKAKEAVRSAEQLLERQAEIQIKEDELRHAKGEIGELEFQERKLSTISAYAAKAAEVELRLGKNADQSRIEEMKKKVVEAEAELTKLREKKIHEGTTILPGPTAGSEFEFQKAQEDRINKYLKDSTGKTTDDIIENLQYRGKKEIELEDQKYNLLKARKELSMQDEIAHQKRLAEIKKKYALGSGDEELRIAEIIAEGEKEIELGKQKLLIDAITAGLEITQNIAQANSEARIAQLEEERDRELKLAGNNAAAKAKIEEDYNNKIKKEKRKQAQQDKLFSLFNIALNTAEAVTAVVKKWAWNPTIEIPLIALAVGQGLLQAAIVASRPLPQFRKGTGNAPEGWASVGEEGYEFIKRGDELFMTPAEASYTYLKGGEKIYTHSESKRLLEQSAKAQEARQVAETAVLHQSLSSQLRKGKEQELIYLYAKAMGQGQNLVHAFKEAVKDIPVFINKWDDRGYHESIRKRNETTNYLNGRHKH